MINLNLRTNGPWINSAEALEIKRLAAEEKQSELDAKIKRKKAAENKVAARLRDNEYKVYIKEVVINRYSDELKRYFNEFSTAFDKYKKLTSNKGKEAALRTSLVKYISIKILIQWKRKKISDNVHRNVG